MDHVVGGYNLEAPMSVLVVTLEEFDMLSRRSSPLATSFEGHLVHVALEQEDDEELVLDFVDYLLAHVCDDNEAESLEGVLRMSGSEWITGMRDGFPGLEKRVLDGVRDAGEHVITNTAAAGDLLSEAWHATFGRNPNPEEAYEKAIKSVEQAAAHVVLPKNGKATLGSIRDALRDQKNWLLPVEEAIRAHDAEAAKAGDGDSSKPRHAWSDVGVVAEMVQVLWRGQSGRHGGNGYRKPTQEEAESAVLLAVPLVQWFTARTVARR